MIFDNNRISYIIDYGDIMKWNLNYIQKNAKPSFNFEEKVTYDRALIDKLNRVDDILEVTVKGNLKYIESIGQCIIKYNVSGIMKVKCAITNEEVDYKFSDEEEVSFTFDSHEEDDEIIYAKGNTVDLAPIVWQLIVVNIPLKVVKEGAKLENKEGKNWKIGDFNKENEPKERTIDPRLESLKNYFDKQ